MNAIPEPARQTPVIAHYDVLVVGGGIAGVAAAVAAARCSAKVGLIERYCGLGGLATLGNVVLWLPLCDGRGNQVVGGLGEELLKLSVAELPRDYPGARLQRPPECWQPGGEVSLRARRRYRAGFNPAAYMLALEELVTAGGVEVHYDTRFCAVAQNAGRITHVIVENKSGRSAIACGTVVDATGDADVCFAAGERTVSLDSNVPAAWFYTLGSGELRLHLLSNHYCPQAGKADAQGPFFRGDSAADVTGHILHSRRLVRDKLAELRLAAKGQDVQLLMPAAMACFRMTRRLEGAFTLGHHHVHRWLDQVIGLTGDWRKAGPVYAIPLGCLRGRSLNLLAAGRCISADSTVWDAVRAIPPCAVTGQAAGVGAALASSRNEGIGDVPYDALRRKLLEQGVLLDEGLVAPS
jgi:hypothetical protein